MLDPRRTTITLGPPGTGKTHDKLNDVERLLASGAKPWEVAFFSFTTKAADEGKQRAVKKFGIPPNDFRYFRTLHSMAFWHLRMRRDSVFGKQHLRELGDALGIEFAGRGSSDDDVYGMSTGDRMLFLEGLARNTMRSLRAVWEDAFEDAIGWFDLERFQKGLEQFKRSRGLSDFNDMMEEFVASDPSEMPRLKALIIDEAQDCSRLQWRAIELLAQNADVVHVAGDDDQAIYSWSGGDVETFINLGGAVRVLDQSHRVPRQPFELANSIAARIQNRRPKTWRPKDEAGAVEWLNSIEDSDLSQGTWLLLARNGYMLRELEDWCSVQGFSYHSVSRDPLKSPALAAIATWEQLRRGASVPASSAAKLIRYIDLAAVPTDFRERIAVLGSSVNMADLKLHGLGTDRIWHEALTRIAPSERDYFIAARRRGEALLKEPRIRISTIHAAKGGEADHVLLMTDVSYRCHQNAEKDPDSENRVFYVGATRCRKTLSVVSPQTNLSYEI